MSAKEKVRWMLRRRGIEISGARWTTDLRRHAMLNHFGIDLVADVGANIGQYATLLRRAGYSRPIVSFEPLGAAYDQLERAAADDPLWETHRTAVGSESGTLQMNVSLDSIFSSVLPMRDRGLRSAPHARYVTAEQVPVERLDDLLAKHDSSCLAVKIDVQGFERQVLEGGPRTLDRAVLVEVELSPVEIYEGQMLMVETLETLSAAGLTLSYVENLFPDYASGRALQFNGIFTRA